jgi:hypothetical protein
VQQLAQAWDGRVRGRCEYAGIFSTVHPRPCNGPCADRGAESERGPLSLNCLLPLIGSEACQLAVDGCHVESGQVACSGSKKLHVMVLESGGQAQNRSLTTVNVRDVCKDGNCDEGCSQNRKGSAYKLIDIEKWPASFLLGFLHRSPSFDINDVKNPQQKGRRPCDNGGVLRDMGPAKRIP